MIDSDLRDHFRRFCGAQHFLLVSGQDLPSPCHVILSTLEAKLVGLLDLFFSPFRRCNGSLKNGAPIEVCTLWFSLVEFRILLSGLHLSKVFVRYITLKSGYYYPTTTLGCCATRLD